PFRFAEIPCPCSDEPCRRLEHVRGDGRRHPANIAWRGATCGLCGLTLAARPAQSSGWLAASGRKRQRRGIRTPIGRRLPKTAKMAKVAGPGIWCNLQGRRLPGRPGEGCAVRPEGGRRFLGLLPGVVGGATGGAAGPDGWPATTARRLGATVQGRGKDAGGT